MATTLAKVALDYRKYWFRPIAELDPDRLAGVMDGFGRGYLREAALLWDKIVRRDERVNTCVSKRKRSVARLAWQIVPQDTSPLAAQQKEALQFFFDNLEVSDVAEPEVSGGIPTLIKCLMNAVCYKYSVQEIEWRPRVDAQGKASLTAKLSQVPLWFFENLSGRLRLLESPGDIEGKPLSPNGWLVSATEEPAKMEATCCIYLYKSNALADWNFKTEKFGIPWTHGKTDAQPNTPEWNSFVEAISGLGSDSVVVTSKDDEVNINTVASGGETPHPALVEYQDRAIVSLWLGGDLSTMSREGGASGSNPQKDTAAEVVEDDAVFCAEKINRLAKMALELLFGHGVECLAKFTLGATPEVETEKEEPEETLAVNVKAIQETKAFNALKAEALKQLAETEKEDWAPLMGKIEALADAKDEVAYRAAVESLREEFPTLVDKIYSQSRTADVLGEQLAKAAVAGMGGAEK